MEFAVFFLSVFAVFVASTAAPMPCDTPEQWEGTATLQDQENGELYIISLSYDAKNNRTRSFTVLLNGQEHKYGVMPCTRVKQTMHCKLHGGVLQDERGHTSARTEYIFLHYGEHKSLHCQFGHSQTGSQ
jgi:hypothetical protein